MKMCAFCLFLLHVYIKLHGSKNVNILNLFKKQYVEV